MTPVFPAKVIPIDLTRYRYECTSPQAGVAYFKRTAHALHKEQSDKKDTGMHQ